MLVFVRLHQHSRLFIIKHRALSNPLGAENVADLLLEELVELARCCDGCVLRLGGLKLNVAADFGAFAKHAEAECVCGGTGHVGSLIILDTVQASE